MTYPWTEDTNMARARLFSRISRRTLLFASVGTIAIAVQVSAPVAALGATIEATPVWSQLGGGPRHSSYNSSESLLTPSTVAALHSKWMVPTGGTVAWPPAVVNGVVYTSSFGHKVLATRADTGKVLWTRSVGTDFPLTPAVGPGRVYVVVGRTLRALDANTGAVKWTRSFRHTITAPVVDNGTVYLAGQGKVQAFRRDTGARRWTSANLGDAIESSPAVSNGVVYAGVRNGRVYALKSADGSQLWSFFAGLDRSIFMYPVVANAAVYAVTSGGNIIALNPTTGAQLWTGNGLAAASVAAGGGVVYSANGNTATALDAATGTTLWTASITDTTNGAPLFAGGVVYLPTYPGSVTALDANTGATLWHRKLGQFSTATPVVANGTLYVGSDDGNLYAFTP